MKLLGVMMILSVPIDLYEFTKIFTYRKFFEEDLHFYLFVISSLFKLGIAVFCAYLFIMFFKKDAFESRQGLEKSFKL
jgi:hypothetical protein